MLFDLKFKNNFEYNIDAFYYIFENDMKPIDDDAEEEGGYFYYGFVRDLFNDKKEYVETDYISVRLEGYDESEIDEVYDVMYGVCIKEYNSLKEIIKQLPSTLTNQQQNIVFKRFVMFKIGLLLVDSNINVKNEFSIACFE